MTTVFRCTLSLTLLAIAFSVGDNRYGAPHSGNSVNHRNLGHGGYRGPSSSHLGAPSAPVRPAPVAYGGARNYNSAPAPKYNNVQAPKYNNVQAPKYNNVQAPKFNSAPYGARGAYGAPAHVSGPSHFGNNKRSTHQQPRQPAHPALNTNYPNQHSNYQQGAESKSQSHGREMKYTINDPHNRGQTHVTETHVVSNRQMHGAEAEAAMKKLMGSMGPGPNYGSDGGFQDFVKGMGLSFY
ncbi:hypothetical protein JTE90_022150 [Oedothorax gibbosus]|uniref:Uncharacterized protein n=1 Tax=Oedothorax gibbosus TaxID=931172 RepID=A0AAV6VUE8_9ARAC|nr:hypothetical protein JTE90_022150 [Oedothorax gibbosus]